MTAVLEVHVERVQYGLVPALSGVSLSVEPGSIVAILGPNGAGKTSFLKSIVAAVPTLGRSLVFGGVDRTTLSTWRLAHLGLVLVPDGGRCFSQLTVEENLTVAVAKPSPAELAGIFRLFPQLERRSNSRAGTLSGGERQMLAIARGLLLKPKVLLLDEPSSGLAPVIVEEVYRAIAELQKQTEIAIVIAEQNVRMAMEVSDRIVTMRSGRILREGAANEFDLRELELAYLEAG